MKHLFVPYNLALELKEKGFDEPCLNYYHNDNDNTEDKNFYLDKFGNPFGITTKQLQSNKGMETCIAAPLYQQVIDWLLSKNVYAEASVIPIYNGKYGYRYGRLSSVTSGFTPYFEGNNRYEALNKAIEEALKLI